MIPKQTKTRIQYSAGPPIRLCQGLTYVIYCLKVIHATSMTNYDPLTVHTLVSHFSATADTSLLFSYKLILPLAWQLLLNQHLIELDSKSQVKTLHSNKLLIHKTILRSIWDYEIQLWDIASTYNIEIKKYLQSLALHMIVDVLWFMPSIVI